MVTLPTYSERFDLIHMEEIPEDSNDGQFEVKTIPGQRAQPDDMSGRSESEDESLVSKNKLGNTPRARTVSGRKKSLSSNSNTEKTDMDRFSSTSSEDIHHYKTKYAHLIIVPLLRSFCYNKYIQNPVILKCGEEDLHKFRPPRFLSTKNLNRTFTNFTGSNFPEFSSRDQSQFTPLVP